MNCFFPVVFLLASAAYAADPVPEKAPAKPAAVDKAAEKPAAPVTEETMGKAKVACPACAEAPACAQAPECPKPVSCPELAKVEAPAAGIGCAKAITDLIAGYRKAADELQAFMEASSERVKDSAEKEKAMQETVKKNEALVTELKFKNTREAKKKVKELERTNRGLWKTLRGINKQSSILCREISKSHSDKIREINNDLRQRLTRAKALMR